MKFTKGSRAPANIEMLKNRRRPCPRAPRRAADCAGVDTRAGVTPARARGGRRPALPGPDRTGPKRAWVGLGALGRRPWVGKGGDWGRGRPLGRRAAASSLRALRVFSLHRGDPWPGWRLRPALARVGWRRMRGVSEPPWGWSRACWGPALMQGRAAKRRKEPGTRGAATLLSFPAPAALAAGSGVAERRQRSASGTQEGSGR